MLTALAVLTLMASVSFLLIFQVIKAEAHARYLGFKNVSAEKVARIIRGAEMNANNIFDDVSYHLDTPESVIAALKEDANLNLDVRGYFAAFEPNFFPEMGTWFEPYIYQPEYGGFEYRQVGSARHNYHKSPWYMQAKATNMSFWSEPYYYYDGTSMSGHYCTFIKPVMDAKGNLACVCGADMKFEWMAKELEWMDESNKHNDMLNAYHLITNFEYYTVILNKDGECIANPEDKNLSITDKDALKNLAQKKSGIIDMSVNGIPCIVYYGPIEFIDWSVAIVVPKSDILKPLLPIGISLLLAVLISVMIIWWVARRSLRVSPQQ